MIRSIAAIALGTFAGLAANGDAHAWGKDGHETVGYIAASVISGSKAAQEVGKILHTGETLATAAEWPDCAKGFEYCHKTPTPEMKKFASDNPAHHNYHYTDIPFENAAYKPDAVGASPDDVVHALQDAIRVLQGKPVSNPGHKFTKRDALFILAHMVGDIHQPLHVGAAYVDGTLKFVEPKTKAEAQSTFTEGGNWLCIGSKGLHGFWDTDYVKRAMKKAGAVSSSDYAAALLSDAKKITKDSGDPIAWPEKWATESLNLAAAELRPVSVTGTRLQGPKGSCGKPPADPDPTKKIWTAAAPGNYVGKAIGIVPGRLEKAGSRLAHLLQAIWP